MRQLPTAHHINPMTGDMEGASEKYEKRLSDLKGVYLDNDAFRREIDVGGDRVVYSVRQIRPRQTHGDLIFGTTHMEPGCIGNEFFVTRGHIHARANRPETYYGERGHGLMLMESPEGETQILDLMPRVLVYVPPMWIHRSVNVGSEPLVMSFCYPCDSGQDYEVIQRSGGMAKRILSEGYGWAAVDNPTYRKRDSGEIRRILETTD